MRILVIASWYPTEENKANGIFFKEQAECLSECGYEVDVISIDLRSLRNLSINKIKKNHFQIEEYIENGVYTLIMKGFSLPARLYRLHNYFKMLCLLYLFKIYKSKRGLPDLIHAHCALPAGYVAFILKKRYNVPFILTEHSSSYLRNLYKKWHINLISKVFENADKNIAVSRSLAEAIKAKCKVKKEIEILHNMVNIEEFSIINRDRSKDNVEKFKFINVAFLNKNKRHDLLIRAFMVAFGNSNDVELIIGGDGPEYENICRLIRELGLEEKIKLKGFLERDKVVEEMRNADVFVLSSDYETFGVVLIEAMACGLPVIATKCGGPEEIVTKETGILVEKNDIDGLAKAMQEIKENYNKFDSQRIREHVIQNFSREAFARKMNKIIKEVVK